MYRVMISFLLIACSSEKGIQAYNTNPEATIVSHSDEPRVQSRGEHRLARALVEGVAQVRVAEVWEREERGPRHRVQHDHVDRAAKQLDDRH